MPDLTFPSFSGGEIAPAYYGRTDQEAYFVSAKALLNYIASQTGPAIGRGGTTYVFGTKNSGASKVLLVPFQFNEEQAYVCEFGDGYVRFYKDRGIISEDALTITGVTQADPAVVTVNHALTKGKTIRIAGVTGMTQLNGNYYLVDHALGAGKNITAATKANPVKLSITTGHGYVGGEDVFIESVGGMVELNDRTFRLLSVTGNILSIAGATQANPVVITTAGNHGLVDGQTVLVENVGGMTEINNRRFVISPNYGSAVNVSGATQADPCVITTSTNHGFSSGDTVLLENLGGMVELNDREFVIGRSLQASKTIVWIELVGTNVVRLEFNGVAHNMSTGDFAFLSGFGEAVELNGQWTVTSVASDVLTLDGSNSANVTKPAKFSGDEYFDAGTPIAQEIDKNKFTLPNEDSTAHTAYTSGGTAKKNNLNMIELDSEDGTGHTAYTVGGTATEVIVDDFYLENENGLTHTAYTSGGTTKAVSRTSLKLQDLDGNDLDSTGFTAYSADGTLTAIHEIASPYSAAELFDDDDLPLLQWVQSNDNLFLAHPDHHPRQLTRIDHDDWELTEFANLEGPFLDANDADVRVYVTDGEASVGSAVTINSTEPLWDADHVAALWLLRLKDNVSATIWTSETAFTAGDEIVNGGKFYRCTDGGTSGTEAPTHDVGEAWDGSDTAANCKWRYIHSGRGIVRITDVDSASQVQAVVITELPAGVFDFANATTRWSEGAWSNVQGFPRSVAIHERRLTWGGTELVPLAMDFSSARSLFLYNPVERDGTVTQATAFRRALDSNNPIRWMRSTEKGLIVGTLAGEWVVETEGTTGQGFGPATATARQFSENGAAAIMPVRNGDSLLYPQRARKRMRDITFSIDQQKLVTSDRNLRADHILQAGICEIAYAEEPHRVTWGRLGDGRLAGLTYNREPGAQVSAWHGHVIGGSFGEGDSVVESIAVIPGPDETTDDLWLSVKRTIDGETVRYIEFMRRPLDYGEDIEDGIYMDAALTYSGAAATNVTGLEHLEGETVDVLAGGVYYTRTVTGATFSEALPEAATPIHVGIYTKRRIETMFLDSAPGDTVNTKMLQKRVSSVQVEVVESAKGWVGTDEDYMDQMVFDEFADDSGAPDRFTGSVEESINDESTRRKSVIFEQREPYPSMITSITPRFEVGTG